jgi:hypothetical protein
MTPIPPMNRFIWLDTALIIMVIFVLMLAVLFAYFI